MIITDYIREVVCIIGLLMYLFAPANYPKLQKIGLVFMFAAALAILFNIK